MNILKTKRGFEKSSGASYAKDWIKILGYIARGRKNRVSRISKSRTIKANLDITQHVKRNRVYHLVKTK